ncbi:MAG: TIGR04282 family arsenosugar biosynthesis glycosyltransferase [Microcoleaceae cyanobacterium]
MSDFPVYCEKLIVFTRYPILGKTKTRLIPVLGEDGATKLHRQLTEKTISTVKKLFCYHPLSLEVNFAGGTKNLMQNWLGDTFIYEPQPDGDLGERMAIAFQKSFESGYEKVIIIGTDCPTLKHHILREAFEALNQNELVLGPAEDGGYYLIGLRHFIPQLFENISWGTSSVLEQTNAIALSLNLSIAYLPILADIDRPEDLSSLDLRCFDEGLIYISRLNEL